MKNAIEIMVPERLYECVDMIRHHDVVAEHLPLLVEESQSAFNQAEYLWLG